jgi:hypothetical protein
MDEENFSVTYVKFGSAENIDNFYFDIIFSNDGNETIIINVFVCIYSQNCLYLHDI